MVEITSKLKDDLLRNIQKFYPQCGHRQVDANLLCEHIDIDFETLEIVLRGFQNDELIGSSNIRQGVVWFTTLPKLHDFLSRGGYSAAEAEITLKREALELAVERLNSIAHELKETNSTLAERVLAVGANIATILGFTIPK